VTGRAVTGGASRPVSGPVVTFGDRLAQAFAEYGRLCVGIDPHPWLLAEWNLPDTAAGASEFGRRVVEAAAGRVGIIKPQVAFFERFGSTGFAALERVLTDARAAGLVVIADAKRGDLGTTAEAYGQAWLAPGSPLEADAMTVSAYMGVGSLDATIERAQSAGKGLFVLAATSNPEAALVQRAVVQDEVPSGEVSSGAFPSGASRPGASRPGASRPGRSVARAILEDVAERNSAAARALAEPRPIGSLGVVLGATLDLGSFGIDVAAAPTSPLTPVLAPGFGHQGAEVADAVRVYGGYAPAVIVSESRSVLSAGPDRIAEMITQRASEVNQASPIGQAAQSRPANQPGADRA
jgi:orotidine-5'-phosphate decarboxylase